MKNSDGGFALHIGGEVDVRGSYCALAVASITNILDDQLRKDADSWIIRLFFREFISNINYAINC